MGKIGAVAIIVGLVVIVYLGLLVVMPVLSDFVSTANTTMAASSNMSNYPGTQEGVLAAPWVLWFAPVCIGMVAIVITLRFRK